MTLRDGLSLGHERQLAFGALQKVAAAAQRGDSAIATAARIVDGDAVNIHACKCIWLAAPFGTLCSACRSRNATGSWWAATRDELLRLQVPRGGPRLSRVPASRAPRKNMHWPAVSERLRPDIAALRSSSGPEVTLEEDLARRDLTINAIAQAEDGILYRPARRPARSAGQACCAMSRRPSSKIRSASCGWRASPPASRLSGLQWRRETMALMRANGRARRGGCLGGRACVAGNREGAAPTRRRVFFRVLRECGALQGRVSGNQCAVRRAAAGKMASRNRYRRAHPDGARSGRAA